MGRRETKFYKNIKRKYGEEIVTSMKKLLHIKFKLAKAINKKHFLLRCRSQRIILKSILLKTLIK